MAMSSGSSSRLSSAWAISPRRLEVALVSTWTESDVTRGNQPATDGAPVTTPSGTGARAWSMTELVKEMSR
jgi:hypothetical protein